MRLTAIQPSRMYSGTNLNFKKRVGGEDFPDDVYNEAKKILDTNEKVNSDKYKKDFFECLGDVILQPLEWILYPLVKLVQHVCDETELDTMECARVPLGLATLGLTELLKMPEALVRKVSSNLKAEKFANNVQRCMLAILREKK